MGDEKTHKPPNTYKHISDTDRNVHVYPTHFTQGQQEDNYNILVYYGKFSGNKEAEVSLMSYRVS